jgi:hypothetical protein
MPSSTFIRLVLCFSCFSAQATIIETYVFNAPVISCGSEAGVACPYIEPVGLNGRFRVDLSGLDETGSGTINSNGLLSFAADNG